MMRIDELKPVVIETIRSWIKSCVNEDQLDACKIFIQDTIYVRYGDDKMTHYLNYVVDVKKKELEEQLLILT